MSTANVSLKKAAGLALLTLAMSAHAGSAVTDLPLAAVGEGETSIQLLDSPPGDVLVKLRADNVASKEVLKQLIEVTDVRVDGDIDSDDRVTMDFTSVPVSDAVEMLADSVGMTTGYRRDGEIVLRLPMDWQEVMRLQSEYAKAYSANDSDAVLAALEALRTHFRSRNPAELTPSGDLFLMEHLAERYRSENDFAELVALRRELLAYAERYDQRPDSLGVALARVELAEALQLATSNGDEDLRLLKLAEPVLMAEAEPLSYGYGAQQLARAFAERGMEDVALHLLESGWAAALAEHPDGYEGKFVREFDALCFDLLLQYRKRQDHAKGAAVLDTWHRYLTVVGDGSGFTLLGWRDAWEAIRRGQFKSGLQIIDVAIARLPEGAQVSTLELANLSNLALGAQLGSGNYQRAALSFARNRALLALELPPDAPEVRLRERQQAVLDRWAASQSVRAAWWTSRDTMDVAELKSSALQEPPQRVFSGLDSAAALLLISINERRKQHPIDLALARTAELTGLLMLASKPDIENPTEAERWLATARQWREELGASDAELAAYDARVARKRIEIRRLMKSPINR